MKDIMNALFDETSSLGVIPESDFHNHVINESIIMDLVNNNEKAYAQVMTEAGKYAVRDNLLEDATPVMDTIKCFHKNKAACCAAALATAKEANDPDYDLFVKAYLLSKKLMCDLKAKYADQAQARVDKCTAEITGNPRIMSAINKANETCDGPC